MNLAYVLGQRVEDEEEEAEAPLPEDTSMDHIFSELESDDDDDPKYQLSQVDDRLKSLEEKLVELKVSQDNLVESHKSSMKYMRKDMLSKATTENNNCSVGSLLEAQNAEGQTTLHLTCRRGWAELVETILEYKEADVDVLDKDGDPPIVFALATGSPECVRAIIRISTNDTSTLKDGFGPSITHVCAFHGQPDCMRVSVGHGHGYELQCLLKADSVTYP
ncbi:E3 ubiquitin-protein ligase KEG-like [Magnolia sinica]|uniref:E3 ubiquitin-protein ligase KEG-like n=1 Tax=Magnolia sinica TaxID=86752 RepID=UPI00265A0BBB|nr:E3 ubiquitin-protein ligase KEG-like [Magnolia sinica]